MKERTESWRCSPTPRLAFRLPENGGGGGKKLTVPTTCWIWHFDLQKVGVGGVECKSTEKVERTHQLPDLPLSFPKKIDGGQKADRKLSVPTNSWICHFDFQKKFGGGEKGDRKLNVPNNSWICHFDFQKMGGGEEWKGTQKVEGAQQLLDLPLRFPKKMGGGVKERAKSWGCALPPGFLTTISKTIVCVCKSAQKAEGAHQLLDFQFDLQKMGGGRAREKVQK